MSYPSLSTTVLISLFLIGTVQIKAQTHKQNTVMNQQKETPYNKSFITEIQKEQLSCKLTTPELQKRKENIIANLKNQIIEKKELEKGYAFKFAGTDKTLDELTEFIKTERECCSFFTFTISVSGDKSDAWLELTGNNGAKEFITSELGF